MRRPIVIAAAVTALAAGGTAIAAPGALFPGDPKQREAELAKDLSEHLDGVSASQIEQALQKVREQRIAEHRAQLARELASRLDGVTATEVERALQKVHEQLGGPRQAGEPPRPGAFVAALAKELGRSEADVRDALQAAHRSHIESRLDAAVKAGRISESQAAEIRERIERGGPAFFGHGPWHGGPG
jgi:glutathione S-transferase